jgi:hypothetical protein
LFTVCLLSDALAGADFFGVGGVTAMGFDVAEPLAGAGLSPLSTLAVERDALLTAASTRRGGRPTPSVLLIAPPGACGGRRMTSLNDVAE